MTEPKFKPAPAQEPIPTGETPPKAHGGARSGAGRPKRDGSPPKSRSLQLEISGLLTMLNFGVMLIPIASIQQDAMDDVEIFALSTEIDKECQRNARFRKMVEAALAVGGGSALLMVVALITMRRMARHGILPKEADAQMGIFLRVQTGQLPPETLSFTPPAPVEQDTQQDAA